MTNLMLELDPVHLVEICRRLLRVGVPPTAVANAFDLDPGPIKAVARNMRREAYGTDELAEAHAFLTWLAYEQLLDLIQHGSPEIKLRAAMQIQSKAMAVSARQTPEELTRAREAFADFIDEVGISDAEIEAEQEAYEQVRAEVVPTDDMD